MSNRRQRSSVVVPIAGGAVGAIVAVGVAVGVAVSGATGGSEVESGGVVPTTVAAAGTTGTSGASEDGAPGTPDTDRPAPLDVLVAWDGAVVAFSGVAQSGEQVASLGPDAPGSVDIAGPGSVTADAEVGGFGDLVAELPDLLVEAQARLTVHSVTLTGTLAPGVSEDDVAGAIERNGLGGLDQQLDVSLPTGQT